MTSSQLVRALRQYRRGHEFKSRATLNFVFSGFVYQLLKLILLTAMMVIISYFRAQFTYVIISIFFL